MKGKYWYFITSYYCPQCSGVQRYMKRRYDERPDNWKDRHNDIESWDYCDI